MIRFGRSRAMELGYMVLAAFLGDELFMEVQERQPENHHPGRFHSVLWKVCDEVVRMLCRIQPLQRERPHLFCIAHRRYMGRPFSVDGIRVKRFDPVIEIHMDNKVLTQAIREQTSVVSLATRMIKEAKQSLPALAACISSGKYHKAQILYGITLIHRGVERFGFSTYPIRSQPVQRFFTWYLRNILRMTNPSACALLESHAEEYRPKIVAMSKHRFLQAYGRNLDALCCSDAEARLQ